MGGGRVRNRDVTPPTHTHNHTSPLSFLWACLHQPPGVCDFSFLFCVCIVISSHVFACCCIVVLTALVIVEVLGAAEQVGRYAREQRAPFSSGCSVCVCLEKAPLFPRGSRQPPLSCCCCFDFRLLHSCAFSFRGLLFPSRICIVKPTFFSFPSSVSLRQCVSAG